MKKLFFTLALLLSVFALSAQSFVVYDSTGEVVENGTSFYIYGDGEENWGELKLELSVTALDNVRLIAEKVEGPVVEQTMNYICWGQCLDPSVYVSNPYDMTSGMSDAFSMHYMYTNTIEEVAGLEQIMTYYLYPANNPDDKFTINVTFKYSLANIEDYSSAEVFGNAYPVPASDVVNFDYNFASSVNAEVAIFNMMGQEVLRSQINGVSGKASINVSDLADGVYFYSLIVNGKTEKSNKIVIRK